MPANTTRRILLNSREKKGTPGLRWTPTTKMGINHGLKVLKSQAEHAEKILNEIQKEDVKESLRKGIVPKELKKPTYGKFLKESHSLSSDVMVGATSAALTDAAMTLNEKAAALHPERASQIIGLGLAAGTGIALGRPYAVAGIKKLAYLTSEKAKLDKTVNHRMSPEEIKQTTEALQEYAKIRKEEIAKLQKARAYKR